MLVILDHGEEDVKPLILLAPKFITAQNSLTSVNCVLEFSEMPSLFDTFTMLISPELLISPLVASDFEVIPFLPSTFSTVPDTMLNTPPLPLN